jgi:hypothetical protein
MIGPVCSAEGNDIPVIYKTTRSYYSVIFITDNCNSQQIFINVMVSHFQCTKNGILFSYLCICLAGLHGSKRHFSLHCFYPVGICNKTVGCYFCIHRRKFVVSLCHQLLLLELELSSCMLVIQLKHQSFLHIKTSQSFLKLRVYLF